MQKPLRVHHIAICRPVWSEYLCQSLIQKNTNLLKYAAQTVSIIVICYNVLIAFFLRLKRLSSCFFYEAKCTRKSKTNNFENEILLFYYHNHARQIVNIDAFRLFLLTMLYKKNVIINSDFFYHFIHLSLMFWLELKTVSGKL